MSPETIIDAEPPAQNTVDPAPSRDTLTRVQLDAREALLRTVPDADTREKPYRLAGGGWPVWR
jgi:hypothetical protein